MKESLFLKSLREIVSDGLRNPKVARVSDDMKKGKKNLEQ